MTAIRRDGLTVQKDLIEELCSNSLQLLYEDAAKQLECFALNFDQSPYDLI